MSEIIEALKASGKDFEDRIQKKKSSYELTQEQLADIYFSSGERTKKQLDAPLVIRVVEKPALASAVPWIITSVAFLITALSLFSTKRVFIDVKIIDEKSPYLRHFRDEDAALSGADYGVPAPAERARDFSALESGRGAPISSDGALFEGGATSRSESDREGLKLVAGTGAPFSRAQLQIDTPIDITGSKLVFYARGAKGGERLGVALKDRENVNAFPKGTHEPFPAGLSSEWQRIEIPVSATVKEFDERHVSGLRFEFGTTMQNHAGDTVWIRDLEVVPL